MTENLSTISMGVEHLGQRKQVGWVGEEVEARVGAASTGRRAGADRGVGEWSAGDWPGARKSGCGQSRGAGRGAGRCAGTFANRASSFSSYFRGHNPSRGK